MTDSTENDAITKLPGYTDILSDLKADVISSRARAASAVNRELVGLYWRIGQAIVEQQKKAGWGKAVVKRLADDLKYSFPDMRGFSPLNLWRMRSFYLAWTDTAEKLSQAVTVLEELPPLPPLPAGLPSVTGPVASPKVILSQLVTELPWGHNLALLHKLKDPALRLWYLYNALINGWSRNILTMQIETALHQRQGQAITNFPATLPPPDSDLAMQILKDPYNFDFLGIGDEARERETERALVSHLKRFLLELGEGFALVGQQYRLTVGKKDYYIDLLFYHINLRAYVAVELKAGPFEPAAVGQLNFYLSALDDKLRHEGDNPAIGLILCRNKDKLDVEYALRGINQPLAVADYHLTRAIPESLKGVLPTIEEIEAELSEINEADSKFDER